MGGFSEVVWVATGVTAWMGAGNERIAGWPRVATPLTARYKESMSTVTPGMASGAQRLRRLESVVSALLEHGTMSRTELAEKIGRASCRERGWREVVRGAGQKDR